MDTADQLELDVVIEDGGTSAKKVTITIPADAVDEKIEYSFGTLQDQAQMRGFRKGHAPRQLLEKRFGKDLLLEARGQLIGAAYQQAIEEKELKVIGEPEFPDELADQSLERGKPFTFSFTVEVVPEFDLPELQDVAVKKPVIEIGDSHVDEELERLRYRMGTPERITGPFEALDRMVGTAKVTVEDHEGTFFETEGALITVPGPDDEGKGPVLGLMIDDLLSAVEGKSTGDSIELETVGPPAHEREEIRGKKVTINYDIDDAERITPLEIDEVPAQLGLEGTDMLKERVRLELETRRDSEQRNAEREQVYEYLLENTSFELPARMSEAQITRTIERQRMEMLYRGMEPDQVEMRLAEIRGQAEEHALNRLKLQFIMARVAQNFEIQVTEEEINGRIAGIARQRGERPDQVRTELAKTGAINEVAAQILEHKAADRIVDMAKVTEVPAEEWNTEAQAKAAEKTGKKKSSKKKAASKKDDGDEKAAKKKTTKKTTKKSSKKS